MFMTTMGCYKGKDIIVFVLGLTLNKRSISHSLLNSWKFYPNLKSTYLHDRNTSGDPLIIDKELIIFLKFVILMLLGIWSLIVWLGISLQ